MDPAVLDELRQRQPRDLAAQPVEGREDDGVRRVVDDEVDAGEVLERTDVAALPADDPALHVVGRELDDRDGRLGRVARRDALERVGDEVAGAALRLRPRFVLEHADAPREVVAGELLPTLEQMRLRLGLRHPRDALELGCWAAFVCFSSSWSWRRCSSRSASPWSCAQLDELPLDLLFLREDALLDLQHLLAPVCELRVDLAAQPDGLLAGLDLRLAPHRIALAAASSRSWSRIRRALRDSGRAEDRDREQGEGGASGDPDGDSDPDQHVPAPRSGTQPPGGTSHPAPDLRGSYPRSRISGSRDLPELAALPRARPPSRRN